MNIPVRRLQNQGLVGTGFGRPTDAVRWLGAMQAQDYAGARWALAQRTTGWDSAALDRAFDDGAMLRTHVLRPTWHLVAPADLRWLLALTGPRILARAARRLRELELDEATLRRGDAIIVKLLEGGQARTRTELGAALHAAGVSPAGQRLPYLLMHAELLGLICSGPLRGRQHTFALVDARVQPAPARARDEALAELVRRYVASHGPATLADFAWWSGLTIADGRRGLEALGPAVEQAVVDGRTYWKADAERRLLRGRRPIVHLLPNYDELTVGYRDHETSTDPRAREALAGWAGGVLGDVIALDGLIVGRWRRSMTKTEVVVQATPLVALSKPELRALAAAADRFGKFVGLSARLEVTAP